MSYSSGGRGNPLNKRAETMQLESNYWADHQDLFRRAVLEAMDKAMHEIGGRLHTPPTRNDCGAQDEDLPELFKGIDHQFKIAMGRLGHTEAD